MKKFRPPNKMIMRTVAGIVLSAAATAEAPAVFAAAAAYGPTATSTFFATGGASLLGAGAVAGSRMASQVEGEAAALQGEATAALKLSQTAPRLLTAPVTRSYEFAAKSPGFFS